MSNGSMLPPDLREKVAKMSQGGIGSAARENAGMVGAKDPADDALPSEEKKAPPREELKVCPNPSCRSDLKDEWNHCAMCGQDLVRGGPAKKLGITFTDDDMESYLFRGYVVRELPVLGKHKITVKSSQPKDLEAIDDFIMNGDWGRNGEGTEKRISDFYLRQMNAMCVTATAVVKVDGESIGDTLAKRMTWMSERGSAFVDLISQRVTLFNQALTEFLKAEDSILGS